MGIDAVAIAMLLADPAFAVPTCNKIGERLCDTSCHMNEGMVAANAYVCVEIEGRAVPELHSVFAVEYSNPPGYSALCGAVLGECGEWASEGGGGN